MGRTGRDFDSINEYIAQFPASVQEKLKALRAVIREAAPDAVEKISYRMPTFYLKGNLVHFAAYRNHIGFYPAPSGIERYREKLSDYQGGKGSVQFPLDQPIPYDLVSEIVRFRVQENLEKAAAKEKNA
ncbi:MAG: DUF1801 domain-containing protein [Anaerolineales bacterium]|nr:DUF1801 domain-containing protein [Anaerolineales bacterium]